MNIANQSQCGLFQRLVIASLCILLISSCYTTNIATHAQAGSVVSKRTVNSFFWGLIQSPKRVTTPICDSLGTNGMAEVTVKNNLGYSLITVGTLGIWSPTRIEWRCGKPCPKVGNL